VLSLKPVALSFAVEIGQGNSPLREQPPLQLTQQKASTFPKKEIARACAGD
jgi:hypothetical protein